MFQKNKIFSRLPNYFRNNRIKSEFRDVRNNTARDGEVRNPKVKRHDSRGTKKTYSPLPYYNNSSVFLNNNSPSRDKICRNTALVHKYLNDLGLDPFHDFFASKEIDSVDQNLLAKTAFEVKQAVFPELKRLIPTTNTSLSPMPVQDTEAATGLSRGPRKPKLVVIPDDYISEPAQFLEHKITEHSASTSPSPLFSQKKSEAHMSLEESVGVLFLYDAIESEDGALLLQILYDVRQYIFTNVPESQFKPLKEANLAEKNTEQSMVRLPLPELLYALSNLGVIEEALLKRIAEDPVQKSESANVSLARRQLLFYSERDLVLLLYGLYRFGLQNDPCFLYTLKRLENLCSEDNHVVKKMKVKERKLMRGEAHNNGGGTVLLEEISAIDVPQNLTLCIPLLLGVLTSLSLSIHRTPHRVKIVTLLLVANALREFDGVIRRIKQDHQNTQMAMVSNKLSILSKQLFYAVKLCESIDSPQPILLLLFEELRESSGKDTFTDGGEDSAVSSDRIAYYDHVTADLIKLPHTH